MSCGVARIQVAVAVAEAGSWSWSSNSTLRLGTFTCLRCSPKKQKKKKKKKAKFFLKLSNPKKIIKEFKVILSVEGDRGLAVGNFLTVQNI